MNYRQLHARMQSRGVVRERTLSRFDEVIAATEAVVACMSTCCYAERDRFAVELAVHEGLVNAIRHGHRGDERRQVRLRFVVDDRAAWVEIEDQGPGFDPRCVPDPRESDGLVASHGRGVFLMRALLSLVVFDERGSRVILVLRRGARSAEAAPEWSAIEAVA